VKLITLIELFKNCSYTNLLLPVKLIEKAAETYQAIKNVNAIETKEDGEEE